MNISCGAVPQVALWVFPPAFFLRKIISQLQLQCKNDSSSDIQTSRVLYITNEQNPKIVALFIKAVSLQ